MSATTSWNTFVNSLQIFRNIATSIYALRLIDSVLCCLLSLYLQSIQPCSPAPRSEEVALLNGLSLASPSRCLSSWPMRAMLTEQREGENRKQKILLTSTNLPSCSNQLMFEHYNGTSGLKFNTFVTVLQFQKN